MAIVNYFSYRWAVEILRSVAFGLFLVAALCVPRALIHAAPVTLRFEGVVGPPRQGTFPIELPFSFAEGDPISGSFTFDPVDVPSDIQRTSVTQSFPLEFRIDSVALTTPSYNILVTNDDASDEDPTPRDRILLHCVGAVGDACIPLPLHDAPHITWSFSWTLGGDRLALDGADIPESPAPWNQLTPSALLVSFLDTSTGRGTGFQATIDSFFVIPEPDTVILVAVCCSVPIFVPLRIDRYGR